ncbi:HD domain-containing protein [Candidatus Woesearchaeota archaeon]|nr:HD domain-containing protein [Candidatus Woesearchaeota archaeon]
MGKVDNKTRFKVLLHATQRKGIEELVSWLDTTDFFTAPASTRLDYHGCRKGGLLQHSLNVYDLFEQKAEQFDLGLPRHERTIASLLHDLCKVNVYKPNMLKKGASKSKPYVSHDEFPFGHGEKSAYLAEKFIELTKNEALLIRWHMGPYDPQWEAYEKKVTEQCPAICAFHFADNEAAKYMG